MTGRNHTPALPDAEENLRSPEEGPGREAGPDVQVDAAGERPVVGVTPVVFVPVVGIGASAGGLEAFTQLLSHLPADTGMAYVLVQHLAPAHESMLAELLGRQAVIPVTQVTDGMRVEPDHVYVIPPNTSMRLAD
ncbi:MAG TPA: chemotaxis protein CheB, partial [Gemmatimonadaceae bacterium]